jgi:hypothetical protein
MADAERTPNSDHRGATHDRGRDSSAEPRQGVTGEGDQGAATSETGDVPDPIPEADSTATEEAWEAAEAMEGEARPGSGGARGGSAVSHGSAAVAPSPGTAPPFSSGPSRRCRRPCVDGHRRVGDRRREWGRSG